MPQDKRKQGKSVKAIKVKNGYLKQQLFENSRPWAGVVGKNVIQGQYIAPHFQLHSVTFINYFNFNVICKFCERTNSKYNFLSFEKKFISLISFILLIYLYSKMIEAFIRT